MREEQLWEVVVVGGGIAGCSAAIYLGRAMRKTAIIDAGDSLAKWEPSVENYLGFPETISGPELLKRGRAQAERYKTTFIEDEIESARREDSVFVLRGKQRTYR